MLAAVRQEQLIAMRILPIGREHHSCQACQLTGFRKLPASRSMSGAARTLPRSLKKTNHKTGPVAFNTTLSFCRHRSSSQQRAKTAKRSQQNDGPRPPRDYRRPPGADRCHERAAHRGTSLLSFTSSCPSSVGAARRRRPAAPTAAVATPPRQRHRRASRTLSRAPRPSRPHARPQN